MRVGVPGGVFKIDVNQYGSSQYWTGTVLKAGPVDIVIHGDKPVPNDPDPDPSNYSMHIAILGNAATHVDRIEQVDFSNGTVSLGPGSVNQLKNGKLAPPYDDKDLHIYAKPPVFGNIDGYPGELAAVFLDFDDSGTGQFGVVDLFALTDGIPALVAIYSGGDRAEGGLVKARIEGGHLVVDVFGAPPGSAACCPTFIDTVRYRFAAGKLVRDGKSSRRKYVSGFGYKLSPARRRSSRPLARRRIAARTSRSLEFQLRSGKDMRGFDAKRRSLRAMKSQYRAL
jgi:hypothetical protein